MFDDIQEKEDLIQNLKKSKDPGFATKPTWIMAGCEKKVKIGYTTFNVIDYLEAWCHIDCNTHRSEEVLSNIRRKIQTEINNTFNR